MFLLFVLKKQSLDRRKNYILKVVILNDSISYSDQIQYFFT